MRNGAVDSQVKSNTRNNLIYGQHRCSKGRNAKESLPQGIEGEVISVYTVKSIFDGMKKTYMFIPLELIIGNNHMAVIDTIISAEFRGWMNDRFGRKKSILLVDIVFFLGPISSPTNHQRRDPCKVGNGDGFHDIASLHCGSFSCTNSGRSRQHQWFAYDQMPVLL
ncbi:hypothetical protein MLD38_019190 [Melastoma candidum]|uniref:Uncharacterized protein n=1 Tax=Melastoma candidum TaxID=119954 RepID=A0ACB9QZN6_9MYRT|nr:hypothetical protein MLD38_019190 [Melastoma candidum]